MAIADPLENLLPSLIQCFSIIFIGYLAVKTSLITSQTKALGTYVTKFALPALFFRSMATINFNDVNWFFILAISLGKLLFFIITIIFTLLITRPINFGMAGILSMFITQSNDVALGYPILIGLYPDLAKYIYLFAPTQLVFINPICFIFLELHEYHTESLSNNNTVPSTLRRRILLILKNVILNPLVYMTVIGVVFNFILSHHLPLVIDKTLKILADSFSGVALFYLGINMVDKLSSITKQGIYILTFILLGKLIFLPFLTRELVVHLVGIQLTENQTLNYSLVGFLYGGLPTAPPVFLIANEFNILPDVIATGLVIGTFLSGPLMFITGRVITMTIASKYEYDNIIQSTALSMSTISIIGCIWVLVVFILSRRWKSPVHRVTMCYSICVLMSCLGMVIGRILLPNSLKEPNTSPGWGNYIQFSVLFIGCTGARFWTCLIALSLAIIKRKSVSFLIKHVQYFYLFGFCVPICITASILIFAAKQRKTDIDPAFQYGRAQLICSIVVLAFSIIATIFFLVLQVRFEYFHQNVSPKIDSHDDKEQRYIILSEDEASGKRYPNSDDFSESRRSKSINRYRDGTNSELIDIFDLSNDEEFQMNRHTALTIVLVVTMGFGFFLCLWRLINEKVSGIYIELEFLDCVFNFGQGFILWAIFGLDTKLIVIPCKNRIMKIYRNIHKFYIPKKDMSPEICLIKNQFCSLHLDQCRDELPQKIRQNYTVYLKVFTGCQLINWILKANLAEDRIKAQTYGQALLISGIMEHIGRIPTLVDDEDNLYRLVESQCDNSQESDTSQSSDVMGRNSPSHH